MNFCDFNYTSRKVEINEENLEKKEWRLFCVDYHNFSLVPTSTTTIPIYIIYVSFYELWRKNYKLFVWTDWRLSRLSHLKNLDSYKYIDHDIENFTASVINIK